MKKPIRRLSEGRTKEVPLPDYTEASGRRHGGGVPLGGVGAGSVELCRDGRFRNIAINNNRVMDQPIPVSDGTFLAIRAAQAGRRYCRILQSSPPGTGAATPEAPPCLSSKELRHRSLYPAVHYALDAKESLLDVVWTAFSPFIPFDHESSTLPAVLLSVRVSNRSTEPCDASVLFNWENLVGCSGTNRPRKCAPVAATVVEEDEELLPGQGRDAQAEPLAGDSGVEGRPRPRFNAVEFGSPEKGQRNTEGHYCLAVRRDRRTTTTVVAWDHEEREEREQFWGRFVEEGDLSRVYSTSPEKRSGAVCCSFRLAPATVQRIDMVLSWYCPRFFVHGVEQGNGYTNSFASASEVALQALRHVNYYFRSVQDWQNRVMSSSLPVWLNRLLVNSAHVFSTNALYTRDGLFSMMESPDDPRIGRLGDRLYSSLGTLLFFQRFEESEMRQFAEARDPVLPELLCRRLGTSTLLEPDFGGAEAKQVDLCAQFVLSAYRDYAFTGNLARIQAVFPRLKQVMRAVVEQDRDQDGLPEPHGHTATFDGIQVNGLSSISAGTWVAAVRAYARLCGWMKEDTEAARFEKFAKRGAESFERLYWSEHDGYYHLGNEAAGALASHGVCHSAQLTGQWYASFLGLGLLFQPERIARSLASLHERNSRANGFVSATATGGSGPVVVPEKDGMADARLAWPAYSAAHYACLQIYHGSVEQGLHAVEQWAHDMHRDGRLQFDASLKWDAKSGAPARGSAHRPVEGLSVWYLLYALQGFELNLVQRSIRVMPNLASGIHSLHAPMFTPSCLGWLKYQQDTCGGYRQRLHLSFDSPVRVECIELRVPADLPRVAVECKDPNGTVALTVELRPGEKGQRLLLYPKSPLVISSALSVQVTQPEEESPDP